MLNIDLPKNEPVFAYDRDSKDREGLINAIKKMENETREVPNWIAGKDVRTERSVDVHSPHARRLTIAKGYTAGVNETTAAISAALAAKNDWERTPFEARAAIFLKAADLLAGPYRYRINASCMVGQGKTVHQSEIDAVCELVDFLRFNVKFAYDIMNQQPKSAEGMWNRLEYRPLEGFIYAISPFNFLSIAINIPLAPILFGNVAVWKPSTTSLLGCSYLLDMMREAGLPDGVLNMIVGDGPEQSAVILEHPMLAGIHFTGSTATFKHLWKETALRLDKYKSYPRIVGETGGKDFIVAHKSADVDALFTAIVRGGYEYQGQKCSAPSRIYMPQSIWNKSKEQLIDTVKSLPMGPVTDFKNFVGAVIDQRAFDRVRTYQQLAKESAEVLAGGNGNDKEGFFIEPTLVRVQDPKHRLMQEEIFGPLVSLYVYDDSKTNAWSDVLSLVDSTSPFALTGAVFSQDRQAIVEAHLELKQSAGNFYINDKPTGAVVGQQPFGGARASGTNDKAGSPLNLLRWVSPRTVKETFVPPTDYRYPYMNS